MKTDNAYLAKKKLKVLFVGFSYVIDVYQSKLKACHETEQMTVALLSPDKWKFPEWKRIFCLPKTHPGIMFYPAKIICFNGRGGAFIYPVFTFVNVLLDLKPDIIYVEQEVFSLATFEAALLCKIFKIPLVVFCWENMQRKFPFYRRWTTNVVLQTASFITPGNKDAADLLERWGYVGPMKILPQIGVDTNLFSPRAKKENGMLCVGFVGRLVYEKGVDLILNAAKLLYDQGYKFRISICGDGPYRRNLEQLAEELHITDSINWLGEMKYAEVPDAMAKFDVLVLPSRTAENWKEQFGHVLIEAMSMEIPVIGSSSGAIQDVIGRKDVIFMENNFYELSEIIKRMFTDSAWKEKIIEFGRERVQNSYTDKSIASSLVSIFEKIIKEIKKG